MPTTTTKSSAEETDQNNNNNNGDIPTSSSSSSYPSVIFLNHFVWRFPMWNMTRYFEQVQETLNWLEKTVSENNNKNGNNNKKPILIWIGGVRPIYEDAESTQCRNEDTRNYWRMNMWKLDEFFEKYISNMNSRNQQRQKPFQSVHYISRHDLTSPLHYSGATFGHFGVHYGATTGMCLTGVSRSDKYGLDKCWRNTAGDWMLIQWWLSILDGESSSKKSTDSKISSGDSGENSGGVGVVGRRKKSSSNHKKKHG